MDSIVNMDQEGETPFKLEILEIDQTPVPTINTPCPRVPRVNISGQLAEVYEWSFTDDGQLNSSVVCKGCRQPVSGRKERMLKHLETCVNPAILPGSGEDRVHVSKETQQAVPKFDGTNAFVVAKTGRKRDGIWQFFTEEFVDNKRTVKCNQCLKYVSCKVERLRAHVENCTADPQSAGGTPKPGRKRDEIWQFYTEEQTDDKMTAQCNRCLKHVYGKVERLRAHLANCPADQQSAAEPPKLSRKWDEIWQFFTEEQRDGGMTARCNRCLKEVASKVEYLRVHYLQCVRQPTSEQNAAENGKLEQQATSSFSGKSGRRRDPIWQFFSQVQLDNKITAQCNRCAKYVSYKVERLRAHYDRCRWWQTLQAAGRVGTETWTAEPQTYSPAEIQVMDIASLNETDDEGKESNSHGEAEPQTGTAATFKFLKQYSSLVTSSESSAKVPAVNTMSDRAADNQDLREDKESDKATKSILVNESGANTESNLRKRKITDTSNGQGDSNDHSSSELRRGYNYWDLLNQALIDKLIKQWLIEDIPSYDIAGFVVGSSIDQAAIFCKSEGVLCGQPFVTSVFKEVQCEVTWEVAEGSVLRHGQVIAKVKGPRNKILQGERLALNIVTRASGIATVARNYRDIRSKYNWSGEVAATRKTTPGFRLVEKYAVIVGGCSPHRLDLSSMIMLKDNHIWAAGDVTEAVKKCRQACGFSTKIEVECRSYHEAKQAMTAGADILMLDNFTSIAAEDTAEELKKLKPTITIEVSGGINETNIGSYMVKSIDVISTSTLTQGYRTLDFSCKIIRDNRNPLNPTVTSQRG